MRNCTHNSLFLTRHEKLSKLLPRARELRTRVGWQMADANPHPSTATTRDENRAKVKEERERLMKEHEDRRAKQKEEQERREKEQDERRAKAEEERKRRKKEQEAEADARGAKREAAAAAAAGVRGLQGRIPSVA